MRVLSLPVRTFTLPHFHIFSCYEDPFTLLKSTLPSCINYSLGNFIYLWFVGFKPTFCGRTHNQVKIGPWDISVRLISPKNMVGEKLFSDSALPCCLCTRLFWEAAGQEKGGVEELQDRGAHQLFHRVLHTMRWCCQRSVLYWVWGGVRR